MSDDNAENQNNFQSNSRISLKQYKNQKNGNSQLVNVKGKRNGGYTNGIIKSNQNSTR